MSTETSPDGWEATRQQVLNRDGHACRFCGIGDDEHRDEYDRGLSVHHIIPESDGGQDHPGNLITVCRSCHKTLESTHAKAISEIDRGAPPATVALIRRHIDEIRGECKWLWHDQLPKLSSLPAIEDRDLPGGRDAGMNPDLTDRERACYILGQIDAYSHAGTQIEAALDHVEAENVSEQILDRNGAPPQAFVTPESDDDPEFYNSKGW